MLSNLMTVGGQVIMLFLMMIAGYCLGKTKLLPLTDVANTEKKVPIEWINAAHNGVEKPFIDYVLPLIQGEPNLPKVDSLPRFAKLKKVLVK